MTDQKSLTDYLLGTKDGLCLTEEGLDAIWPKDDTPSIFTDGKTPYAGPPTCAPGAVTLEESAGRESLIGFVFDGPSIEQPPMVPLPGAVHLLAGAILLLATIRVVYDLTQMFKMYYGGHQHD